MTHLGTLTFKRRFVRVTLPDETVIRLRSLYFGETHKWKETARDPVTRRLSDAVLLALSICDDNGNQVVSVDDALTGFFDFWDNAVLERLIAECVRLSVVEDKSQPIAVQVEAALKNLSVTPGSTSSGDSQRVSA